MVAVLYCAIKMPSKPGPDCVPVRLLCPFPAVHAVYDQRARGSVRRVRQEDCGPLLPAGSGQTMAHALPKVLRVQTQPRV